MGYARHVVNLLKRKIGMNQNYFKLEYSLYRYYRLCACIDRILLCFRPLVFIVSYPSRKPFLPPLSFCVHTAPTSGKTYLSDSYLISHRVEIGMKFFEVVSKELT